MCDEENKKVSVHSRENVISQSNGIKRTKVSLGRDLKKMRLFKDSDEENDPDDPLPQEDSRSVESPTITLNKEKHPVLPCE